MVAVHWSVPRLLPFESSHRPRRDPHPNPGRKLNLDRPAGPRGCRQSVLYWRNGDRSKMDFVVLPGAGPGPKAAERACRRQTESKLGWALCPRATSTTLAAGAKQASRQWSIAVAAPDRMEP